jgi:hypothetical protein
LAVLDASLKACPELVAFFILIGQVFRTMPMVDQIMPFQAGTSVHDAQKVLQIQKGT